ncbi:carbohydrate ABC transporter permease [Paenibacillus arenilitoris]|uniref:Carbohydrate ABC transporter permease n=1 Tax=Paenibacillus arenilitoris TaxID=2772299 RepID=A0A927CPY2_9BACL|nr:carbohydrate ABC transporter permease [Paenibacillus arenilitoris]MBD2871365.1 carbohydrate ABC transporter permease [Paenibacillus arenilitoris]
MKIYGRTLGGTVFDIVNYAFFALLIILCLYPFWYMLVYSISEPSLAAKGITLFPRGFTLFNYKKVMELEGIYNAFFISVMRTVTGTALSVFLNALLGYLFSRTEMPGRKFLYRMLLVTMYVSGGLIPYYLVIKNYGLLNNFFVYIIPGAIAAFNVILIKTFIESLPDSLQESAMLDGAGYFTIFSKIIMPLCLPIIATIAVFSAVGNWNSWFDNYIFVSSDNLRTLQLTLYEYLNEAQTLARLLQESGNIEDYKRTMEKSLTPRGVQITVTMITTIPILLVYPYMQRFFIKGIMVGAIKG